ncbi:6585_t:CDS:2 [Paraglomus brasilianum]|uniref:6585_t:CDS:1 n=1 Tax=Paraglomus brasilianum TaxID=144538 RepID=A0A9N8WKK5_9GLOM|nr:6585_t:CDS:2 [Paraglomus brasilianum]
MGEDQNAQANADEQNPVKFTQKVVEQGHVPSQYIFSQSVHNGSILEIPNNFGDIMTTKDTILHLPEGFSGLERICLAANGNLQRILSAWFNGAVTVQIVRNIPTSTDLSNIGTNRNGTILRRYNREVNLCCKGKVLCNATSDVVISDNKVVDLIENEGVGIGQLFRYLGKLPTFDLHFVGRTSLTWWRLYTLRIAGVSCRIKEVFPNGMFTSGWIDSSQTGLTRADIETVENETIWPSSSIEIF